MVFWVEIAEKVGTFKSLLNIMERDSISISYSDINNKTN